MLSTKDAERRVLAGREGEKGPPGSTWIVQRLSATPVRWVILARRNLSGLEAMTEDSLTDPTCDGLVHPRQQARQRFAIQSGGAVVATCGC
jgi:hypothetical protein